MSDSVKNEDAPRAPELPPDFGAGKSVLLVDDDPTTVQLVSKTLEQYGFSVVSAEDGLLGWDELKPGFHPQMIILDVIMPAMDGHEFLKQLRSNPETKKLPVLIMTSRRSMEDTFIVLGANDFIAKPFETGDFLQKVKKLADIVLPPPPEAQPEGGPEG